MQMRSTHEANADVLGLSANNSLNPLPNHKARVDDDSQMASQMAMARLIRRSYLRFGELIR